VLDIASNLQDQVPPRVKNEAIYVDFASLEDSVGKVAYNDIFIHPDYDDQGHHYRYRYRCIAESIAESFTDYFIQYVAVIIILGYLPKEMRLMWLDTAI
jgi:hypothetical protein